MSLLFTGCSPEYWGLIPSFLNEEDKRPVKEQFAEHYISGWKHFDGFKFDEKNQTLSYHGDPPMKAIGIIWFHDETIILFPHAWVLILQKNGKWEVCRMD